MTIPGVKIYGQPADGMRTPTIAFTLRDLDSEFISRQLVERGIFTSNGDFYATTIVDRLGLAEQGLVRIGCACYTTSDEIDRLIEGVREIAAA